MIFVTGGTGLVGSHLLYELLASGQKVRALKRNNSNIASFEKRFHHYYPNASALLKNLEWIEGDITDIGCLQDAMDDIDTVYHCAALVSFKPNDRKKMFKINVDGTANMINVALDKKIKTFCHVSSIAALGRAETNGNMVTEESFWKTSKANSNYAISKYEGECEVWRGVEEGLGVVIVNPSVIIGPADWNTGTARMFTMANKGLRWYTHGTTGFIDVRDVVKGMLTLVKSNVRNEKFLLNGSNLGFKDFFEMVCEKLNKPVPSRYASPVLSELGWRADKIVASIKGREPYVTKESARAAHAVYRFSGEKIKKHFPEFEYIPVDKMIADTCAFFKKDFAL